MSYIKNSDIAVRLNLNPFKWEWIPFKSYEKPTVLFPNRVTIGFGWLLVQVFIDIDNGKVDFDAYQKAFAGALDDVDFIDDSID